MLALGLVADTSCFRRRRIRNQSSAIMSATPAQPPTTLPAIVPALLEDEESGSDFVGDGASVFVSVVVADSDFVGDVDGDGDADPVPGYSGILLLAQDSCIFCSTRSSPVAITCSKLWDALSSSPSAQPMPAPPSPGNVSTKACFPCRQQK